MLVRKIACAVVIVALSFTIAAAEEFRGKITKLESGKITFQVFNKDDKKFEDAKSFDLAKDVKVSKKNKDGKEDLADGLKNDIFKSIDEKKGVNCTIVVNDEKKVTEIVVGGKKKKGT